MNVKNILYFMAKNEMDLNFPLHFVILIMSLIVFIISAIQVHNNNDISRQTFVVTYFIFWISFGISCIITGFRITKSIPNEMFSVIGHYKCLKTISRITSGIFYVICMIALESHIFRDYDYLFCIPFMCVLLIIMTHLKRVDIERKIFSNDEYIRKYNDCINNLLLTETNRSDYPLNFKKYEVYLEETQENPFTSCVICLDNFQNTDNITILRCNHIYHYNCVSSWFTRQPNCPICRTNITEIV